MQDKSLNKYTALNAKIGSILAYVRTKPRLFNRFLVLILVSTIGGVMDVLCSYLFYKLYSNELSFFFLDLTQQNTTIYLMFTIILTTYGLRLLVLKETNSIGFQLGLNYNKTNLINLLKQDYVKIRNTSEASVSSSIGLKTDILIYNIFTPITKLFSSLAVCSCILLFCFYHYGIFAMYFLVLIIAVYVIITLSIKKTLEVNGKTIEKSTTGMNQTVSTIYGNLRQILIENRKDELAAFNQYDFNTRTAQLQNILLSTYPKIVIEALLLVSITTLIISADQKTHIASELILAGMLGLRFLPLVQNVFSTISAIMASFYIFESNLIPGRSGRQLLFDKNDCQILAIDRLYFKYLDTNFAIEIRDINIRKDGKYLLEGRSGSGKTTLLDVFAGLIEPNDVEVINKTLTGKNISRFFGKIYYCDQNSFIEKTTPHELFNLDCPHKLNQFQNLIREFELNKKLNHHTILDTGNNTLSGGQRQKLRLIQCLMSDADSLFLDEALSAIDEKTSIKIIKHMLSVPKTIIFTSHNENIKRLISEKIFIE